MSKVKDNLSEFLALKNKSAESVDLFFYGDIVSSWFGAWDNSDQYPSAIRDFLNEADGRRLNIYINSPGGAVFAGMAIYNMLKRYPGHKTCHVDGLAASIASVIAFAADEVIIPKNAFLMVHRPWTIAIGNKHDLEREIAALGEIEKAMYTVYESRMAATGNIEAIRGLVEAETYLSGEEAAMYFDIKTVAPMPMVAYAGDLSTLPKLPEGMLAAQRHSEELKVELERLELMKLEGVIKQ